MKSSRPESAPEAPCNVWIIEQALEDAELFSAIPTSWVVGVTNRAAYRKPAPPAKSWTTWALVHQSDPSETMDMVRALSKSHPGKGGLVLYVPLQRKEPAGFKLDPGLDSVILLRSPRKRHVLMAVIEATWEPQFGGFKKEILGRLRNHHLRALVRRAFERRPPSLSEAIDRIASGKVPFDFSVESLAEDLGGSSRYWRSLAKAEGLRLGPMVKGIHLSRAVSLFHPPVAGWREIALRVGMSREDSLLRSIHRYFGVPAKAVVAEPLESVLSSVRSRIWHPSRQT